MIIPYKNLTEEQLITKYFDILNAAQMDPEKKLSGTEIELFVMFLSLLDKGKYYMFSPAGKNVVTRMCDERGWSMKRINLNNKIYSMLDKGYLRKDPIDKVIMLSSFLEEGVKRLLASHKSGKDYDIVFRFSNEKSPS